MVEGCVEWPDPVRAGHDRRMGTTGGGQDRGLPPQHGDRYVTPIGPGSGGPGRWRWLALLAGFLVLVGVIVVQRRVSGPPSAAPGIETSSPDSGSGPGPARTAEPPIPPPLTTAPATVTVTVTQLPAEPAGTPATPGPWTTAKASLTTSLAPSVLPRSPGWEIVGYGSQGLVRIDPSTGRVWLVDGPPIVEEWGAMTLVSSGGHTLIVAGNSQRVLVPDAGPARTPYRLFGSALTALPGPDPAHVWTWDSSFDSGEGGSKFVLHLVDWTEQPTGTAITLPSYIEPLAVPVSDGDGYMLVRGIGGTYDARPDGLTLVTSGDVIAAGPTGYLVYECGAQPGCSAVTIDRKTGTRATFGQQSLPVAHPRAIISGQISPDGAHAVYLVGPSGSNTTVAVHLFDMSTGEDRVLPVTVEMTNASGSVLGFSPDGRYLAVASPAGRIDVLDTSDAAVFHLPWDVPPVQNLVTRSTH